MYFFQGQKYTCFGKNILHSQSASLGHSATGHSGLGTTDNSTIAAFSLNPILAIV